MTFSLDEKPLKLAREYCDKHHVSFSAIMNDLLVSWVKQEIQEVFD